MPKSTREKEKDTSRVGSLCAVGCEALYGLSYLFTKGATEVASPFALLGWRFAVAFAALALLEALRLGGLVELAMFRCATAPSCWPSSTRAWGARSSRSS